MLSTVLSLYEIGRKIMFLRCRDTIRVVVKYGWDAIYVQRPEMLDKCTYTLHLVSIEVQETLRCIHLYIKILTSN
jgi:hypothetical protein